MQLGPMIAFAGIQALVRSQGSDRYLRTVALAMHAVWHLELIVSVATHSQAWFCSRRPLPTPAMNGYWSTSRQRLDCWHEQLHRIRGHLDRPGAIRRASLWAEAQPLLEEILISEVTTRVLACFSDQLERRRIDLDSSAIAHSIMISQLDARHRCLHMMVYSPGLPVELAVHLNRLRHLLERWNDSLLGLVADEHEAEPYCFSRDQVRHSKSSPSPFMDERSRHSMMWRLLLSSIRNGLGIQLDRRPFSPRLNAKIAEHLLQILPADRFDDFGTLRTEHRDRLMHVVEETNGFIDDLSVPLASPLDILLGQPREAAWQPRPREGT